MGKRMVQIDGPFDGKWSKVETFENGQPTTKSFIRMVGEALGIICRKCGTRTDTGKHHCEEVERG